MHVRLTRRQLVVLVLLTLTWGINWPIMKVGVSGLPSAPLAYPPLTFRALSMALGLPVLWLALQWLKVPLAIPRAHWPAVARLTGPNMLVWHIVIIFGVQALSSGRSAILGYTMPIFAALAGAFVYGERLDRPGKPPLQLRCGDQRRGVGARPPLPHEVPVERSQ